MRIIGLTGGIATGKSTVSRAFRSLSIPVIDADLIAHQIMEPGQPGYRDILRHFGTSILHPDGRIDREKLGAIIFADAEQRKVLNKCTHPHVRREIWKKIFWYWFVGERLIVLDVPLLIESGMHKFVSAVVVVFCSEKLQLSRLMARDNSTEQQAKQRIRAQMPLSEKCRYANHIIDNSGSKAETERQVRNLVEKLQPNVVVWLLRWAGPVVLLACTAGLTIWLSRGGYHQLLELRQ
ncbi:uncharacterized protein VTP21DRAFT_7710 [Calcarisporiella thermophila]|uniref:uncharacterized protein n=1 Tax=Calcarisporiella thermophila TaxID=911321 RepID=UPI00374463DF